MNAHDAADAALTAEHERRLRDDPDYAARWRENIRAFADAIDTAIAESVFIAPRAPWVLHGKNPGQK